MGLLTCGRGRLLYYAVVMSPNRSFLAVLLAVAMLAIPAAEVCARSAAMRPGCPMMQAASVPHSADFHDAMSDSGTMVQAKASPGVSPCHREPSPASADCCAPGAGTRESEAHSFGSPRLQTSDAVSAMDSILAPAGTAIAPAAAGGLAHRPRDRCALLSTYQL